MTKVALNSVFEQQNKKLVPATFKKAVISGTNIVAFTADVYFSENPTNIIRNVPLAAHIDPTKILIGDKCRVDIFDETNIRDFVVAYIYGRKF